MPWSEPSDANLPIPSPSRKSAKTALQWLASRVPKKGPHVELFPTSTLQHHLRNGRVSLHPNGLDQNSKPSPTTATVYCQGIFTSRDSPDSKPQGVAVATLQVGQDTWRSTAIGLGESVTKFDAQLVAFRPALILAEEFLESHQQYQGAIYIMNNIKATVPKFADSRLGPDQPTMLSISQLSARLLEHADVNLKVAWHDRDEDPELIRTTKQLALEIIRNPTGPNQDPQTINYQ